MILVAGVLVLLVIVATVFMGRTQSGRVTASAVRQLEQRGDSAEVIARSLAGEVSDALFVWPVDPFPTPSYGTGYADFLRGHVADSNVPRFRPDPDYARRFRPWPGGRRYGVDPGDYVDDSTGTPVFGTDGVPDFSYNFAPYHTVPWTNWPDDGASIRVRWPRGPGSPNGLTRTPLGQALNVANPLGNPGFGDTRWLRDTEPFRWDTQAWLGIADGEADAFKYWRHLTNVARPNNGWRIVRDTSDVFDADGDGVGGLLVDLSIPVEQWTTVQPDPDPLNPTLQHFNLNTGQPSILPWFTDFDGNGQADFIDRWQNWMSLDRVNPVPRFGYSAAYLSPALIPQNYYDLRDLDGDGNPDGLLDLGERPVDEFRRGSWRHTVNRVLADADGDGFTDSFWFMVPGAPGSTTRQIAAVSIVDNGGLLDANVATRFNPDDTLGLTPSDLALVGEQKLFSPVGFAPPPNWNVGFLDNYQNRENLFNLPFGALNPYGPGIQVAWGDSRPSADADANRWRDFLAAAGVLNAEDGDGNLLFPDELWTSGDRVRYWLDKASRPFDPASGLMPFTLADELELRMYHGQNQPWIYSRFESVMNTATGPNSVSEAFLRSAPFTFRESIEYLDRLNNTELLHDHRRKLTLFSGARNDLLPPWLWWRWNVQRLLPAVVEAEADNNRQDLDENGIRDVIDRFINQSYTKLDLREANPAKLVYENFGARYLHERLPWTLLFALTDGTEKDGDSYYGPYRQTQQPGAPPQDDPERHFWKLREAAAGLSANILAQRDFDDEAPLFDDPASGDRGAVLLPEWGTEPADPAIRMLGLERQPFIAEAFVGHVYKSTGDVPIHPNPPLRFFRQGDPYVTRGMPESTVVAVQIANPFVRLNPADPNDPCFQPLDLRAYTLRIAGLDFSLRNLPAAQRFLCHATDEAPVTAVFYAIDATNADMGPGFAPGWRDFLDINVTDLAPGSIVVDLFTLDPVLAAKLYDRSTFDGFAGPHPIELVRTDPDNASVGVVVDRVDQLVQGTYGGPREEYGEQFADVLDDLPEPPASRRVDNPGNGDPIFDGIRLQGGNTHWVSWARFTRAWGYDVNFSSANPATHGIQPSERAPRFVFAEQDAEDSDELQDGDPQDADEPYRGSEFDINSSPDRPWFDRAPIDPIAPWRQWLIDLGIDPAQIRRKPTFFNMNVVFDPSGNDLYPSFLGGQFPYGFYFYGVNYNPPITPPGAGIPDKGFYGNRQGRDYRFRTSLDMLQKDRDFLAVGELRDVWLFGHELAFADFQGNGRYEYDFTRQTFSEHMAEELREDVDESNGDLRRVNRLRNGKVIGVVDAANPFLRDVHAAVPALPAGLRVFDAFVCDGPGFAYNPRTDRLEDFVLRNAEGFAGRPTPGLINLNTAPVEVMRALPHWSKLVHQRLVDLQNNPTLVATLKRSGLPEATVNYRERLDSNPSGLGLGPRNGASYAARPGDATMRGERGIAAIGELELLRKAAAQDFNPRQGTGGEEFIVDKDAWRIDFQDVDAFFRVSNLVTTRSDLFTVYFRLRTFRENPNGVLPSGYVGPVWDATDPDFIVDDARYVMLVDRGQVNAPSDAPRILYLEKLPD